MKSWSLLFALFLMAAPSSWAEEKKPAPPAPLAVSLKPRQPNWRLDVVSGYDNGQPKQVLFYEPTATGVERPVKQVFYHENGQIQSEADVLEIQESEPGFQVWNAKTVPHGYKVDFSSEGILCKAAQFDRGLLNGECRSIYANGAIQAIMNYAHHQMDGKAELFYEDGQKKEEANYIEGKLSGDLLQYHPNGSRQAVLPHQDGVIHGIATEWFPSGAVKSQQQFVKGKLHGDGKNPALIIYDEEHHIQEVCDFRQGQPVGLHIRYHQNGKESYRVNYKNGKKDGKEQSFAEDGTLLSEGEFNEGAPIGEHWRIHPNKQRAVTAKFDRQGVLQEPIVEFSETGVCIRKYSMDHDQKQGPCTEWFPDGALKCEYLYIDGQYDGEQKEYFANGQIKDCAHFKKGEREGVQEEWHENGILACRMHYAENKKNGQMALWYPNGICKQEGYFQSDQPDGMISEWYENGQLKNRAEFAAGVKEHWHREWDESGNLLSEIYFDHDQPHGTAITWWNKDQIRSRLHFDHGKKEGLQEWFAQNGQIERVASFANDLMEGEWKSYYADGSPRSIQHFHFGKPIGEHLDYYAVDAKTKGLSRHLKFDDEGRLHGDQKEYYPDQTLHSVAAYDHGVMHGIKQLFDEKGVSIENAHYVNGKLEGEYFQKAPDGREIVFHYKNNLKDGLHTIAYPNPEKKEKIVAISANFERDLLEGIVIENNDKGQKVAETTYVHGKKDGLATFYHPNGKMTTTVAFSNDFRNGTMTEFFPSGAVFRETPYQNDVRFGEEKTYSEKGKLISVCRYENDKLNGPSQSWNEQGMLVFVGEYKEGLRHGKFNKYFDDGRPALEQTFLADQLHGVKKKYDPDGHVTVSNYEAGKVVEAAR